MDLEYDSVFVMMASSIQEAQMIGNRHLKDMGVQPQYEGSFHYFPIRTDETDLEAERRIYLAMTQRFGIDSVWTRKECYESFKRQGVLRAVYGTYTNTNTNNPNHKGFTTSLSSYTNINPNPITSHTSSGGSLQDQEAEKEIQFSISLE